jgi:hypothetical protein
MESLLSTFQNFISDLSQSLNIDNDTLATAVLSSLKKIDIPKSIIKQKETIKSPESEEKRTKFPNHKDNPDNNKCENLGCTKKYKKINKFFDNSIKREINVCTNCFRKLNSKTTHRKPATVKQEIKSKEITEQEKEPGEVDDENIIQNVDFHFGNEPSVKFTEENKKWWKCKTIIYFGKKYKLHLNTNLVFKVVDKTPILYGLYRDNEIHPLEVLSEGIIEWCENSGIEIPSNI